MTRDEEFQTIRTMLDNPAENRPGCDAILRQMIETEQFVTNKLTGTALASWKPRSTSFTSVVDQAEYTLSSAGSAFGKALFVYRDLGSNQLLPVPFTDYGTEIANQSYEWRAIPTGAGIVPGLAGEKLAFFRSTSVSLGVTTAVPKVRIFPIPEVADIVYSVVYSPGAVDASAWDWNDTPDLPEWSHYRCVRSSLFLLDKSEWTGLTTDQNRLRRKELSIGLAARYQEEKDEFDDYITNPDSDPIDSVPFWYE